MARLSPLVCSQLLNAAAGLASRRSRGPSPRGTAENLPSAVASNVATVMPDVTTIMAQVAPIGAQISLVMPDVSTKMTGFTIVPVPHRPTQLPPVLLNITSISANVSPVMTPVNAVPAQVLPVLAQCAALAQRKRRSEHCKHHQTYDLSSHIASQSFRPYGRWEA